MSKEAVRKEMRANGCEVSVVKNNISSRAAKECGYDGLTDAFVGPVALAFSKDDLVAPAKVLFAASKKENSKVEVVKGVVDGDIYDFDKLKALSVLPTQLAAGMLGTLSQLAIGLNMLTEKEA